MFKIRTSKPTTWNNLYNNASNGGLSWCINGCPTDPIANVLANCVGYACARFNEIYNELTGNTGIKYPQLCCNAEEFWQKAQLLGLARGQTPRAGAIMCWEGLGSAAGHVAIVERVDSPNQVFTSESGYNSAYFWNATRYKNDGNWGIGAGYRFSGFIYNPAVIADAWKEINGKWYYYDSNGNAVKGWHFDDHYQGWFLFGSDGAMLTGWQKDKGKWYYLQPVNDGTHVKGIMRTGWVFDKQYNGWFLLDINGAMLTGWQKRKGLWYFLQPKTTKKHVKGIMRTGWLNWKGNKYYLDPKDGYMYTGTHIINGKKRKFDSNGALIT